MELGSQKADGDQVYHTKHIGAELKTNNILWQLS